jgi:hypothetical protein
LEIWDKEMVNISFENKGLNPIEEEIGNATKNQSEDCHLLVHVESNSQLKVCNKDTGTEDSHTSSPESNSFTVCLRSSGLVGYVEDSENNEAGMPQSVYDPLHH